MTVMSDEDFDRALDLLHERAKRFRSAGVSRKDALAYAAVALWVEAKAKAEKFRAEAERWRGRCLVNDDDIADAGVTETHMAKWLAANGWTRPVPGQEPKSWLFKTGDHEFWWRRGYVVNFDDGYETLSTWLSVIALATDRSAWDILDEMAALEVPT
jgi:hypothetical protein